MMTFIVTSETAGPTAFLGFGSSENAGREPELSVTVPESATSALFALGGFAIVSSAVPRASASRFQLRRAPDVARAFLSGPA
ncbi:MAG TPA: hypothetical protein VEH04_02835 [Verrucomicrobiae bacterium]|nr:hypothetical protein [Verrucomicrobiae bacterium]